MMWDEKVGAGRMWRAVIASCLPMAIMMCGAAPVEEGVTVEGGVGGAHITYPSGGCGTPSYTNRAGEVAFHSRASYRSTKHFGVTGEVSASAYRTYNSELTATNDVEDAAESDASELGRIEGTGFVAVRPSLNFKYGGLELGPTLILGRTLRLPDAYRDLSDEEASAMGVSLADESNSDVIPFVSARGWVGRPEFVYGWLDVLAGPASRAQLPVAVGLGHAGHTWRGELGVGPNLTLSGSRRLSETYWLGLRAFANPRESDVGSIYGGMFMFTMEVGQPKRVFPETEPADM